MVTSSPLDQEIPDSYMVVYEVPFKTMYLNPESSTIITIWNDNSANISDEDYKSDAEDTMDLIRDSDAHYMISDHRQNKFNISPDLQKWYAELIANVLGRSSFEKCAVIITDDLNLLSALEEIKTNIEKSEVEPKIAYKFFNGFKEAERWISAKA